MLIRLLPNEISGYWKIIEASVKKSLMKDQADTPEKRNNILRALLIGHLVCWFYKEDSSKIKSVILTAVVKDEYIRQKNLLIYAAMGLKINAEGWTACYDTLETYAKGIGCDKIIFYTANPRLIKIAKFFGPVESYTVCEINI